MLAPAAIHKAWRWRFYVAVLVTVQFKGYLLIVLSVDLLLGNVDIVYCIAVNDRSNIRYTLVLLAFVKLLKFA